MKLLITLINIVAFTSSVFTQVREVPSKLTFADISLKITDGAKEMIQKDVDLLTRSPKYHQLKVERAKTYFPIIERIFEEEGIPPDFKFLVIQESALISDAVSSSNAVGFWQLKDYTALELGLRVDKEVDERMNIVSSTKAAARYFNKANALFDNWLHSLQSYQMGIGGAQRDLGDKFIGAREMTITKNTYWYVMKYIAHKIAFESETQGHPEFEVSEYLFGANKSFDDIARETGIEKTAIEDLNKWLLKGNVPTGKTYTVLLPGGYKAPQEKFVSTEVSYKDSFIVNNEENKIEKISYEDFSHNFPVVSDKKNKSNEYLININSIPGIIATHKDNIETLSKKGEISIEKFLLYNDLESEDQIIPEQPYYFKNKRRKAGTYYHILQEGENLWMVAQKYGIRLNSLLIKNRIVVITRQDEKVGRVLWLRMIRPDDKPIEFVTPEEKNNEEVAQSEINFEDPGTYTKNTEEILLPDTEEKEAEDIEIEITEQTNNVYLNKNELVIELPNDNLSEEKDYSKYTQKIHVIKSGETFYSISKQYNISVPEILEWNNIDVNDKLAVGQKLVIYLTNKHTVNEIGFITHTVNPGETLFNISKKYNVEIQDLMKWNDKSTTNITVGEKIKVLLTK